MSSASIALNAQLEADRDLPLWFVPAYRILLVLTFCLLALGSSVRVMKAGLACPDWPLCFGEFIPDYHPQVYFEFLHRVLAGLVALGTFGLHFILMRSQVSNAVRVLSGVALVILVVQIIFGGLTVILLLKSGVVATHLMLGGAFFISLLWIYLSVRGVRMVRQPRWLLRQSAFVSCVAYGQIFLGGLVAANFASLVCIDFPKCHGEWFPTFSGIIGMHVIHRLGGYFVFLTALANWFIVRKYGVGERVRRIAGILLLCVFAQIGLGIANVLLLTPPLIAVAHLAMAMTILMMAVRQTHASL